MIGHNQIIKYRLQGLTPSDVFLHLKPHPQVRKDGFWNAEETLATRESAFPDVYIGSDHPRRADLSWAYNLNIHLIPAATTTNDEYCQWWIACANAKPKLLIGVDPDGEVNTWTH